MHDSNRTNLIRRTVLSSPILAAALLRAAQPETVPVKVKRKPPDEWNVYQARTVDCLPGFRLADVARGRFGGRLDRKYRSPGFFRVRRIEGRWWLIDPEGCACIHAGVGGMSPGRSPMAQARVKEHFGAEQGWAAETLKLLRAHDFNGTDGKALSEAAGQSPDRLPYVLTSNFMGTFGRSKSMIVQLAGHLGYPGDCIPVFHPEFPAFCDTHAQALDAVRDDPYLIGHFSDNELPTPVDLLDRSLALDSSNAHTNPGCQAARSWLARRKGAAAADITDEDREAFREFVYDCYFALTTAAIRKHDPNHLLLGSRFYGPTLTSPGIFAAAARHVDALSMNIYWQWTPDPSQLAMWSREAAKPFLVTEFYAKGEDAGMGNTSGAGWIVPTQSDRALFYQHFTLALLESRQCIGWDWFKYIDNDPDDPTTDPSNRDSNKGIVNIHYAPYHDLLAGMRTLNRNLYALADYFDRAQ